MDLDTYFAPPERAPDETVARQAAKFSDESTLQVALDTAPEPIVIVNGQRQIVYANQSARTLERTGNSVLGKRPGELVSCVESDVMEGGCGTSEACRTCGAAHAVVRALQGTAVQRECHILTKDGRALELLVNSRPLVVGDEHYAVLVFTDISADNRRRALERIFFHDLLNTAGGIRGLVEILPHVDSDEREELVEMLDGASSLLLDEIEAQRMLSAAERDDLTIEIGDVVSRQLLESVIDVARGFDCSVGRKIAFGDRCDDAELKTDRRLLRRVLLNLVKNALEASRDGMTVEVGCDAAGDSVEFWINNPTMMSRNVQLQVFKRSFSTKGSDRGVGTFSSKLLTERYLGGRIGFTSDETEGTTFRVVLPARLDAATGTPV